MSSNKRKWFGIIITILCYYVVHEGAHLLIALALGVFQKVHFMGLGMQIVIDASAMSDTQLALFNVVGSLATLICGYIMVLMTKRILISNNKIQKAVCWYTTIGLLMIDPLYLSIFCGFFGGGDMNGIVLFGITELIARFIYAIVAFVNIIVLIKYVYPAYKQSFTNKQQ